jgi:hypothetical protein
LVNEALDLRIGIRVIPSNVLLFPFLFILRDRLVKLLWLGALMPTMFIGFRRMVFSTPVASLYLLGGSGVLEVGGGIGFGRARTRGLGSLFRLFMFHIAEHMVSRITITTS